MNYADPRIDAQIGFVPWKDLDEDCQDCLRIKNCHMKLRPPSPCDKSPQFHVLPYNQDRNFVLQGFVVGAAVVPWRKQARQHRLMKRMIKPYRAMQTKDDLNNTIVYRFYL